MLVTFPAFLLTEPYCTVYTPSGNKGLVYFYTYLKDLLTGTVSNLILFFSYSSKFHIAHKT